MDYFWEKGELINFQNSFFKPKKGRGFFRPTNLYWSKDRRISLKRHLSPRQELGDAQIEGLFRGEKYKLSVQLFLDINEVGDSLIHLSKTVLDIFQTHFYLEQTPLMDCFVNIYFDLCEIERLKMEQKLSKTNLTIDQSIAIHEQSKADMETITQQYLKEVQTGTNTIKLMEWNAIVQAELGIDNMSLFGLNTK